MLLSFEISVKVVDLILTLLRKLCWGIVIYNSMSPSTTAKAITTALRCAVQNIFELNQNRVFRSLGHLGKAPLSPGSSTA